MVLVLALEVVFESLKEMKRIAMMISPTFHSKIFGLKKSLEKGFT